MKAVISLNFEGAQVYVEEMELPPDVIENKTIEEIKSIVSEYVWSEVSCNVELKEEFNL